MKTKKTFKSEHNFAIKTIKFNGNHTVYYSGAIFVFVLIFDKRTVALYTQL